jgi:enoyl-CoA hydratase/carnithine racemase
MSDVRVETLDHVGVLTMRRPPTNFFDKELITDLAGAAHALHQDGFRALVIASEGKHFCAGANFGDEEGQGDRTLRSIVLYKQAVQLFRLPIPVIAAVQGSAVGGGLGLACAADFRVAASSTRFHANFVHLGFHPGFGLSESLAAIVGPQVALDLLATGRRITGDEAAQIRLVDRLVPEEQILSAAVTWAQEIARAAPLAVQSVKMTLRGPLADRVEAALDRELVEQTRLWQTEDCQRGIEANLRRATAQFVGR